jgi:hypothetical protein
MKTSNLKQLAVFVGFVLASLLPVQADTLNSTFDTSFDYVAKGIIGDTNWDGVYLGYGDIPYGNAGGNGNGSAPIAGTTTYPGYLGLRNVGGDWAGPEDDGFFLYKVVSGDFDVSVESSPYTLDGGTWFDSRGYHMAGLMVRAYNPNNSGAPFSTTSTNALENYVMLLRFQEFDLDEINEAINGARAEHIFYDSPADTNSTRFYRIVRTAETNFTFYWKTNLSDSWAQITSDLPGGVLTRPDLTGPLQVGIAQCAFSTEPRDAVFNNFELSGTNVSFPAMPAAPSNLQFSSPNTSGSVTLSWTPGAGSSGSLVVMRQNGPLIANPINAINYTADANFQNTNTLMGAGRTHVVYVGSGNSVTVTGLGGSNNTYTAAVFSYSTSSPPVYNTANPATSSAIGPGRVSAVSFTVSPTSIPRSGVARATVTATYSSGDSYDVSADLSTLWTSSDPSTIIAANGTLTAVTNGSATITATYAGITGTKDVSVVSPAFTDNFDANHNFIANGVPGSKWDGLYSRPGDVPGGASGGTVVFTTTADANISSNNVLSVAAGGAEWEAGNDDGFFLFKNVPGDFQAVVHVNYSEKGAWEFVGLMARAAEASGAPFGGSEDRVNWWFFGHPEWGAATSARWAVDGAENYADQSGPENTVWLLLQRVNGTDFYCYQRANATDPWTLMPGATMVQPNLTVGVPVQVGLAESTFTPDPALLVQFDSFMLHGDGINVGTPPSGSPTDFTNSVDLANGTITLTWTNAPGSDGSIVVMRANSPINVAPMSGVTYTANASFGLGSNLGSSNYVVYAGSGNSVTVNNLAGGKTYYASIFAYTNSSGVLIYNQQTTAAIQSAFVGVLQDVVLTVSGSSQIPLDGVGIAHVTALYSGGGMLDVTAAAALTCDNPSVIVITNVNNLDAIALGTASIEAVYLNKTNTVLVTVKNPAYTDNFTTSHDYLAKGVAGTMWDGVYFGSPVYHPANSIPNGSGIGGGDGQTFVCDANTTSNGVLSVQTTQTDWEAANDDGFLLFKNVPGDFQVRVHITTSDTTQFPPQFHLNCGVMARQFGPNGAPSGGALGTNENYVSWSRFDLWGIQTDARSTTADGATRALENRDGSTNYWLLLVKDGADFHFFEKEYPTNLWIERFPGSVVRQDLIGAMQVGIQQATFNNTTVMSQFDSLMLDAAPATLEISRSGSDAILSWPNMPGVVLKSTVRLNPADWQVVSATATNGGLQTLSVPMTNATSFFRLYY